ncbi:lipocalin-like domain-containing protein [Actibacterium sp. XHP0104]|uniref:lipocalin-like domain-containing protein n=1 Tax=Actibacterium sp. XHP0104 TaxID=2984335 RepID=UPI0021E7FA90|nr:lipocalin-like domain-containing protein [Actibacterium sp. XHP0104]MCV2882794.1 iron ABC transporter permease [Actibacterium sp. XHP0104]
MNVRAVIGALALIWAGICAQAQGFAGMGSAADGFAVPQRGHVLTFPADHGAHPDFRIEWWYLTANLRGEDGRDYGVQWTLFRSALAPGRGAGWADPQIWFAHMGLTTPDRHFAAQRFARGGVGQAGVQADPFEAWIDDWQMAGPGLHELRVQAGEAGTGYDLSLRSDGPLVLHGQGGYSVKSQGGQASYYYSQPAYAVSGVLTLPDGPVAVTGQGWLDREWSSQPLAGDQSGWDWVSLHLDDGARLMGFQLRQSDGVFTSGTYIAADGTVMPLRPGALQMRPIAQHGVAGRKLPVEWQVTLPEQGVDLRINAVNPDAWQGLTPPYWEGPVRISGSHGGMGYLEMTGY